MIVMSLSTSCLSAKENTALVYIGIYTCGQKCVCAWEGVCVGVLVSFDKTVVVRHTCPYNH